MVKHILFRKAVKKSLKMNLMLKMEKIKNVNLFKIEAKQRKRG
jgi:hypothetical protein